jgi:hypothetical protein
MVRHEFADARIFVAVRLSVRRRLSVGVVLFCVDYFKRKKWF